MTANSVGEELLQELQVILESERDRLQRLAHDLSEEGREVAIGEGEESGAGGHAADVGSDLAQHELDLTLEWLMEERLSFVEAALERIRHSKYGRCEKCNNQIEIGRLRAIPWTQYCLQCAS